MNTNSLVDSILNGECDDSLDRLLEAIKIRQNFVSAAKAAHFKTGQKVRIVGHISPKYLVGVTATVTAPPRPGDKYIPVRLDESIRKFSKHLTTKIPVSCLEQIPDSPATGFTASFSVPVKFVE